MELTRKQIAEYPNHIDTPTGKLYKRKTCHGIIYLLDGCTFGYVFGISAFNLQEAVDRFVK